MQLDRRSLQSQPPGRRDHWPASRRNHQTRQSNQRRHRLLRPRLRPSPGRLPMPPCARLSARYQKSGGAGAYRDRETEADRAVGKRCCVARSAALRAEGTRTGPEEQNSRAAEEKIIRKNIRRARRIFKNIRRVRRV